MNNRNQKIAKRDKKGRFLPGNTVTRPSLQSPPTTGTEAVKQISEYFAGCIETERVATIPGLALALGFTSRQALHRYADALESCGEDIGVEEKAILDAIKRARLWIEDDRINNMVKGKGSTAGAIFDLKNNFGYVDKQEIEQKQDTEIRIVWDDPAIDVTPERLAESDITD